MQSDSEVIKKRGFRLLVSLKKDEEFTKKISVNFGFLPTTSLGKIKGRPHLSGKISITFFTAWKDPISNLATRVTDPCFFLQEKLFE